MIRRLAVVERGEVAARILTSVASSAGAHDPSPLATVLVHDDPRAWYAREADEVLALEPGALAGSPARLVDALAGAEADTVWLGPWAGTPRADVVAALEAAGIDVIGPSAATLARLEGDLAAVAHDAAIALVAPGGGPARRLDVEVLADGHATVWTFPAWDVSVRRAGVPLVAESPATGVGPGTAAALAGAARRLALAVGYRGAGVAQFALGADGEGFGLAGFDAVARPEQALVEERTGLSVIAQRLLVHEGHPLAATPPSGDGHTAAARLVVTPPVPADAAGAPSAGRVALLSLPLGTGVRVDADRRVGDAVDVSGDPTVAVITAWGPDRAVAASRLRRALERTSVVVDGATTNRTDLLAVLGHPDFHAGPVTDGWLDALAASGALAAAPDPLAVLVAAVESYEADRAVAEATFMTTAAQGRPERPEGVGARIELAYVGHDHVVQVDRVGPTGYTVRQGSTIAHLGVERLDDYERRVTAAGRRHRVVVSALDQQRFVEVDGRPHLVTRLDGQVVRTTYPALVVALLVQPGQTVAAGEPIAVLESMKMESTVTAPLAGMVVAVTASANTQIERGAPLVRIRPVSPAASAAPAPAAVELGGFGRRLDPRRAPCERVYEPLGDYLLGYDLAPTEKRRLLTEQRRLAEIAAPDDAELLACEDGLLDVFADIASLYRPHTEAEPVELEETAENTQEYLLAFVQWLDADRAGLPERYRDRLRRALARYGVGSLEPTPELRTALTWMWRSFGRVGELAPVVTAVLERRLAHADALLGVLGSEDAARLDRLAAALHGRQQLVADLARDVRFRFFDQPALDALAADAYREMNGHLDALAEDPDRADREERIERLVWCPHPLRGLLLSTFRAAPATALGRGLRRAVLETSVRRYYRIRRLGPITFEPHGDDDLALTDYDIDGTPIRLAVAFAALDDLPAVVAAVASSAPSFPPGREIVLDVMAWREGVQPDIEATAAEIAERAGEAAGGLFAGRPLHRLDVTLTSTEGPGTEAIRTQHVTFRQRPDGALEEDLLYRNLHPMLGKRLELWRLQNFQLERRASAEDVYLFFGVARTNPRDRRLFVHAEVRELVRSVDPVTGRGKYPALERAVLLALAALRTELARYAPVDRPSANRLVVSVPVPWTVETAELLDMATRFAPLGAGAGLERLVLKVRVPDATAPDGLRDDVLYLEGVGRGGITVREQPAGAQPVSPLTPYQQKVLVAARFGAPYPYEIVRLLAPGPDAASELPRGDFVELDLEPERGPDDDRLVPVEREAGANTAHLVVGLLTSYTDVVPEGMTRVAILSDPTQGLGNLAEPECRRINAALAYALEHRLPVEWFAVSSGALIAMDSGTENMDYIALTLRRLIEHTQAGGEINIVVTGINVGGQPYWNAEATMLMHTKGILVMTPASAMVLTGKQALDFSGAVSAEDNFGIGGYDHVMGPNGQGQYWAPSFADACRLLLDHYELTYVVPGERFPRRRPSADPVVRDVRTSPHARIAGSGFTSVGDVFSPELNADRKQPFDMRSVMAAVADADGPRLERWRDLRDGETSIVWDATVGGIPVCLLGLESHTVVRHGYVPADGPPAWTSGTLFPHSSRKTARAINACSGNRPLVVLANLSGFDGSPESMRRRQLEFGAEIGRAVTNFDGPIVFVVVSRYHGGAFVVFSKALNASMEIAAVEGSFASVIGGAPAAATVFAREVKQRTERDARVQAAQEALAAATDAEQLARQRELAAIRAAVRSEKLGEVADEFDSVHTIERALRVGSVDRIIPAGELRPYVVDALERGMARDLGDVVLGG